MPSISHFQPRAKKVIAVDVGGTFVDCILYDEERQGPVVHKVSSTPDDPSRGILTGISELCELAETSLSEVDTLLHGTTVGTNAVLEGEGARVGMITTEGFRDILHIGRHRKPYNFSLYQDVPQQVRPLVRRRDRHVVRERVLADGTVETPLDIESLEAVVERLAADGVESVAICLLGSFANPAHEQAARDLVAAKLPEAFISVSSEVVPQYREYERFSTTALNAFLGPPVSRYLDSLASALRERGASTDVHLMQSSGGITPLRMAQQLPVGLTLSGPVGGVLGGVASAHASGYDSTITLDVGGTSADICVVPDGDLKTKHLLDSSIGGYPVMLPMVDIETIGAGGGSIAAVADGRVLAVGPRSAGADPGPACYGRGGTMPTITDASVALGRLSPTAFLGGRMPLDGDLATEAIATHVAEPLGLSIEHAALAIHEIASHNMVNAVETNSVRKGYDPRDFTLVAAGGAGALFAAEIAQKMGIPRALVPLHPGLTAAAGLLASDVRCECASTHWQAFETLDFESLRKAFEQLEGLAHEQLAEAGFEEGAQIRRWVDCRYLGQGYELRTPAPAGEINADWAQQVRSAFDALHEREYYGSFPEAAAQIVNIRVTGIGPMPTVPWQQRQVRESGSVEDAVRERRSVTFGVGGEPTALETPIYERQRLHSGDSFRGPAIVEQLDTTTVIPPDADVAVDRAGNLVISL